MLTNSERYSAIKAQKDTDAKSKNKGSKKVLEAHKALFDKIIECIKTKKFSPYATLIELNEMIEAGLIDLELNICEKTLYKWINANLIEGLSNADLLRKGKIKRSTGTYRSRPQKNKDFLAHSIDNRPEEINERHNGFIRRFIAKGSDLSKVSEITFMQVQRWINTVPRRLFKGSRSIALLKQELENLKIPITQKLMEVFV